MIVPLVARRSPSLPRVTFSEPDRIGVAVDGSPGRRLRPRRVFGLTAALDLLVRYGDRLIGLTRLDPTLPAVSVLAGTVSADATGVVVVAVGFYRYAPALLAPLEARVAETEGFDPPAVTFTEARAVRVCIVVLGLAVLQAGGIPADSSDAGAVPLLGVVVASVTLLPWYCRRRYGWRLGDPDGYIARLLGVLVPFDVRGDLRRDLAAGGVRARLSQGLWFVAFGGLVAFPGITVGIAFPVLLLTFPLPDLVALASWLLGWRRLRRRLPRPAVDTVDPERFTVGLAVPSAGGLRRFLWGFVIVTGIVVGGVLTGRLGVAVLVSWPPLAAETAVTACELLPTEPVAAVAAVGVAWRALGVGVVLLAAATYTAWVWYRRSRRVAAQFRGDGYAPAAPPGSLLPAVVAVVVGASLPQLPTVGGVHLGSAWPAVVAALAGIAASTSGTSPLGDTRRRVVVDGLLSVSLPQFVSVATADGDKLTALVSVFTSPEWIGLELAVVGVVYWPTDTGEPATAGALQWYAPVAPAVVAVGVGLWIGTATDSAVLRAATVVTAGFTTLFAVTRVHERRRAKSNQK